jgi:hypothetical protein
VRRLARRSQELRGEKRSINTLEIRLAEHPCDIDSRARPLENHPLIASPKPVEVFFVPLELLDALTIWNRILYETLAIAKNLVSDLGGKFIKVVLGLQGEEDPEGHAFLVFRLARRLM